MRTLTRGLNLNHDEMRLFDCLRALSELEPKIGPGGVLARNSMNVHPVLNK